MVMKEDSDRNNDDAKSSSSTEKKLQQQQSQQSALDQQQHESSGELGRLLKLSSTDDSQLHTTTTGRDHIREELGSHLHYSILPLLQQQPTENLSRNDMLNLVQSLLSLRPHLLDFSLSCSSDYGPFFSSLVALSANCIISNAAAISKSQIQQAASACQLLLQYLLHLIHKPEQEGALNKNQQLSLIQSLCDDGQPLVRSEVHLLCAILKSSKIPPVLSPASSNLALGEQISHSSSFSINVLHRDSSQDASTSSTSVDSEIKEPKRIKLDKIDSLIDHLVLPILNRKCDSFFDRQMETTSVHALTQDNKSNLISKNLHSLQQLDGVNILLDFILERPSILPFIETTRNCEIGKVMQWPSTVNEAYNQLRKLKEHSNDIELIWKILSLPILEPLNENRLGKIISIIYGALYICIATVIAHSILLVNGLVNSNKGTITLEKDSRQERETIDMAMFNNLVYSSLELYRRITDVMRNSIRVGGQCCQNVHLFTCWLLLASLRHVLSLRPTTNLADKLGTRNGYSDFCIPIAYQAILLMSQLVEDLKQESELKLGQNLHTLEMNYSNEAFVYERFRQYTAQQRIEMLFSSINANSLCFNLAWINYQKSIKSRYISKGPHQSSCSSPRAEPEIFEMDILTDEKRNSSNVESEWYFNSDESIKDEDSEPILGRLFNETKTPAKDDYCDKDLVFSNSQPKKASSRLCYFVEQKDQFTNIKIATQIFEYFNASFVCSELEMLRNYFCHQLTPNDIQILANLIKDLDKLNDNSSSGDLGEFSNSLRLFIHNSIAVDILSSEHQHMILQHLGVEPIENQNWSLFIPRRTLSVIAQIFLLNIKREKETFSLQRPENSPVVIAWKGILRNLKEQLSSEEANKNRLDFDDLNVEHAQLLMFLFHNLELCQRKIIFATVCRTIVDVRQSITSNCLSPAKIIYLSRLLHIFEYMVRHFYETPQQLVEQVDHNLFKTNILLREREDNREDAPFYFVDRPKEQFIEFYLPQVARPKFYFLHRISKTKQDAFPKLDGLALNYIINGIDDDSLTYDKFYDCICSYLLITDQLDLKHRFPNHSLSNFDTTAVKYCFGIAWRLFLQLPPSAKSLELQPNDLTSDTTYLVHVLHTLLWSQRVTLPKCFNYMRDYLCKQQSLTEKQADKFFSDYSERTSAPMHCFDLLNGYMQLVKHNPNQEVSLDLEHIHLPKIFEMFVLKCLIEKVMVTFSIHLKFSNASKSEAGSSAANVSEQMRAAASKFLKILPQLASIYFNNVKLLLFHQTMLEDRTMQNKQTVDAYDHLISVCLNLPNFNSSNLKFYFPTTMYKILLKWNMLEFDLLNRYALQNSTWYQEHMDSVLPAESLLINNWENNFGESAEQDTSDDPCNATGTLLRQIIASILRFTFDCNSWATHQAPYQNIEEQISKILLPLHLNISLQSYTGLAELLKTQLLQPQNKEKEMKAFRLPLNVRTIEHSYQLLQKYPDVIDEKVLIALVMMLGQLVETKVGQTALEHFFCGEEADVSDDEADDKSLVSLIEAASNSSRSSYSVKLLGFLIKLFEQTEKKPDSVSLVVLCTSLRKLARPAQQDSKHFLQAFLSNVLCIGQVQETPKDTRTNLLSLINYLVKDTSMVDDEVTFALLHAMIPIGDVVLTSSIQSTISFAEMMLMMTTLASDASSTGHLSLIKAVIRWLDISYQYLSQKDVLKKLEKNVTSGQHQRMLDSTFYMLTYISDILEAINMISNEAKTVSSAEQGSSSTASKPKSPENIAGAESNVGDSDADWAGDEDEESGCDEESDEDALCNKLCTFTVTQKQFMNQHWYHCHTCRMVNNVGVCTICAKVCHRNHDVTYAKYGSFFCDCGAKEDGNSCSALVRRSPRLESDDSISGYRLPAYASSASSNQQPQEQTSAVHQRSSLDQRLQSSLSQTSTKQSTQKRLHTLARLLQPLKKEIAQIFAQKNICDSILKLLHYMAPCISEHSRFNSNSSSVKRAQDALQTLHQLPKLPFEHCDKLMLPTLGSQEGAFDNTKMNFTGEQGQTIKQLMANNLLKRVTMCAMSQPGGKRQHLAICAEKGKITLLQLSSLLRQADSSRKKLTLNRLSSAPVPFTVLSITANAYNDEVLAVCGLKDCHVLNFHSTGNLANHIFLRPQLESNNYIIKAIWIPGSQTQLALVTADFVKIFDLSKNIEQPTFYFLLPSTKIRDVTFMLSQNFKSIGSILVMSSSGIIYHQSMDESSSAVNGAFYITSALNFSTGDKAKNEFNTDGYINGGGISVFYSHTFQYLFFSFSNGKNFMAVMSENLNETITAMPIELSPASSASLPAVQKSDLRIAAVSTSRSTESSGSTENFLCATQSKPLWHWSEIGGHPGLIFASTLNSNNPVVFMVRANNVQYQELLPNNKSRIMDFVALRHCLTIGDWKTTMIMLNEDGSLRIYNALSENTDYWIRPGLGSGTNKNPLALALFAVTGSSKRRRKAQKSNGVFVVGPNGGQLMFPIDFFESAICLNDIEFGGTDLLQVYHLSQIKTRLDTTGQYIACQRQGGFSVEVINNDNTMVVVGIRVLVGSQDIHKAPTFIEIFGRTIQVILTTSRWFDIPFMREESHLADRRFTIFFGSRHDSNEFTMIDSIKVYGKPKDTYLWPEDDIECISGEFANDNSTCLDLDILSSSCLYAQEQSPIERLISCSVDVINGYHSWYSGLLPKVSVSADLSLTKKDKLASVCQLFQSLIPLPLSVSVHQSIKKLQVELLGGKLQYQEWRDKIILEHLVERLLAVKPMDGEAYFRTLLQFQSILNTSKPANFYQMAEKLYKKWSIKDAELNHESNIEIATGSSSSSSKDPQQSLKAIIRVNEQFLAYLSETFWTIYKTTPSNPALPYINRGGLMHVEATIYSLIEIVHSFVLFDVVYIQAAYEIYAKMLLCGDEQISFSVMQILSRIFKPKAIKTSSRKKPTTASTEIASASASAAAPTASAAADIANPLLNLQQSAAGINEGSVEEQLLVSGVGFEPTLDMQLADGEDLEEQTIVQLAMALSYHSQQLRADADSQVSTGSKNQALGKNSDSRTILEGSISEMSISATGSDEEMNAEPSSRQISGVAITSPVTNVPSSESSLAYRLQQISHRLLELLMQKLNLVREQGGVNCIPIMKLLLLISCTFDLTREDDQQLLVSLFKCLLHLLEIPNKPKAELKTAESPKNIHIRSPKNEVKLIILRMLSILWSRAKSVQELSNIVGQLLIESGLLRLCSQVLSDLLPYWRSQMQLNQEQATGNQPESQIAGSRATNPSAPVTPVLSASVNNAGELVTVKNHLLRYRSPRSPPDMSPLFLKQYVKGNNGDVFQSYPQLVCEMLLRLPYQLKKQYSQANAAAGTGFTTGSIFTPEWQPLLCEYLLLELTPYVHKQVRKLLTYVCGSKERYRLVRDFHALNVHLSEVRRLCNEISAEFASPEQQQHSLTPGSFNLSYDQASTLVEKLNLIHEIAISRQMHWQQYCFSNPETLRFFICISVRLEERVSSILMQILQAAFCEQPNKSRPLASGPLLLSSNEQTTIAAQAASTVPEAITINTMNAVNSLNQSSASSLPVPIYSSSLDDLSGRLCRLLFDQLSSTELLVFVRHFLLNSNCSSLRWQTHKFLLCLFSGLANDANRLGEQIEQLWTLWPISAQCGRRAIQYTDLLGYLSIRWPLSPDLQSKLITTTLNQLRAQNQLLLSHPNAPLYNQLQSYIELDGYYLETQPCIICGGAEQSFSQMKLSALKVDSRFTTTTQIVKLVGPHVISRVSLRITDIKRTKMVRTLVLYYNNRPVQSVVEIRGRQAQWNRAKQVQLMAAQSEVRIDLPLPIIACNLMIEYASFYENVNAGAETLQCPRCSAIVAANPGVCGNCGENVFQCHKCRAINYDEKDPFLCNACGFCKYAKFDYTLVAKATSAVERIENEEDRRKCVTTIHQLLDKANRMYRSLQKHRPELELNLAKLHGDISEMDWAPAHSATSAGFLSSQNSSTGQGGGQSNVIGTNNANITNSPISSGGVLSGNRVNQSIYLLAQRYSVECRKEFDELGKLLQRVVAARRELINYDCRQRALIQPMQAASVSSSSSISAASITLPAFLGSSEFEHNCYGCIIAAMQHNVTMLVALASRPKIREQLCDEHLKKLLQFNLSSGPVELKPQIRNLYCLLMKENLKLTTELCEKLVQRLKDAFKSQWSSELSIAARQEMILLEKSILNDSNWPIKLRCVFNLLIICVHHGKEIDDSSSQLHCQFNEHLQLSINLMESVIIFCLRILHKFLYNGSFVLPTNNQRVKADQLAHALLNNANQLSVNLNKWIFSNPSDYFNQWKAQFKCTADDTNYETIIAKIKLTRKFFNIWRSKTSSFQSESADKQQIHFDIDSWLRWVIFNRHSQSIRLFACQIVESLMSSPFNRQVEIVRLLTSYLDILGQVGESAHEFFELYHRLIQKNHWRFWLARHELPITLTKLIDAQIERLAKLEHQQLVSCISEGTVLRMLSELLSIFVQEPGIRRHYKERLVACVLNGYLCLRKLIVQRSRQIEETQETLLSLLEQMTTGSESECASFMQVCIRCVKDCQLDDLRTPVFIFERICSLIQPEETSIPEFFLTLEKDHQQEDFLQGRMVGNPYSCTDVGPLMRDIKNKICQDCELVALLEDDCGMELLVCNKIISLDLPVREVYRKVWCASHNEAEPMRVIYRLRGLMGDATEEFVQSLASTENQQKQDEEKIFKLAAFLSTCDGLPVMLQRLQVITRLNAHSRPLLQVLLKLMGYCVRLRSLRDQLLRPELHSLTILLNLVQICIGNVSGDMSDSFAEDNASCLQQLMQIIQRLLDQACDLPFNTYAEICADACKPAELAKLISCLHFETTRACLPTFLHIVPLLSVDSEEKIRSLLNHFGRALEFDQLDQTIQHASGGAACTPTVDQLLEQFSVMLAQISTKNQIGSRFKDRLLEQQLLQHSLEYLFIGAPVRRYTVLAGSQEWKEYTQRHALHHVLKMLNGLVNGHAAAQEQVSERAIHLLHALEQISSDSHVGSLAETLLETISQHPGQNERVKQVRRETREEKKRLAMAVRQKQLGELGMRANERGQVTADSCILKQVEDLGEEQGLICCICREGYKFQPNKVLAIYTYSKRCTLEPFELKTRKAKGYSTVTHFNIVHMDCHLTAVRHARARDEWESAALQNGNTRCNGLLPIWGPQVTEVAFGGSFLRHTAYLQECTGQRELSYSFTIHDLKLLLWRFATEQSFSIDSGGGGPQSNIHLIPYLIHTALYVMNNGGGSNTPGGVVARKESSRIINFLDEPLDRQLQGSFDLDGVYFLIILQILVRSYSHWKADKLRWLRRILIVAHTRHLAPKGGSLPNTKPLTYAIYKPSLVFFALVDGIYTKLFKNIAKLDESVEADQWATLIASYIRNNDHQLLEQTDKLLEYCQNDVLPCASFAEFCDVTELLSDISQPDQFISQTFEMLAIPSRA